MKSFSQKQFEDAIDKAFDKGYFIGFKTGWNKALEQAIKDLENSKRSLKEDSNELCDSSYAQIDFEDASYVNRKFLEDLTRDANKYFDDLISSGMSKDDAYGKVGIFIAHKIAGE